MNSLKSFLMKLPKAILLVLYIFITVGLWTLFIVFPFSIDDYSKYIGMVAVLVIQFGISLLFKRLKIIQRNSFELLEYITSKKCIDAIIAEEADAKLARADKEYRKIRFERMKPKIQLYGTATLIIIIVLANIPSSKKDSSTNIPEVASNTTPMKTGGKKDETPLLWRIFHGDDNDNKKAVDTEAIYLDRIYGEDSKSIYMMMKSNGILPYADGSDAAKLSAIVVGGYVYSDDHPCFEGKNPSKCLVFIKEALGSEKFKSEMPTLLARIKPIPAATNEERKKMAHEEGRPMCEDAALRMVSIPSTASFSWGSTVSAYTDGTFELLGKFTHKNAYGQQLKKEYSCEITLTKMGRTIRTAKITSMIESY